MKLEPSRPPLGLRLAAAAVRRLPSVRGRGRLEVVLHRALGGHGWQDVTDTNGYSMEVLLDDLIGRMLYLNGEIEPVGTALARALVRPGAMVFDVGAHAGYFSLLFSRLVGAEGAVQAFEPVPETAARLRSNLAMNPALEAGVRLWEVALSDREGHVKMNVAGAANTGASHVVAVAEVDDPWRREAGITKTVEIECRTGDSIWKELGRPEVSLVKIDVEGHEIHALRGLREMLSAGRCTVLAEVRDPFLRGSRGSREELFGLMGGLGFGSYDFDLQKRRFVENDAPRDAELVVFSNGPL
jgi:FkbM family methyltransferase